MPGLRCCNTGNMIEINNSNYEEQFISFTGVYTGL